MLVNDPRFTEHTILVRLDMGPADLGQSETYKIVEGSIFGNDPLRIHSLMLSAIKKTGNVEIVSEPRRVMALANGLVVADLPKVIEMQQAGDAETIWDLSDELDNLVKKIINN